MANSRDVLLDLERRREQLEKTVTDLRKSLQHWQTWEADYEGFKEEILSLGQSVTKEELV
jgi:unconventional prefoldin RPB5 interactor 1